MKHSIDLKTLAKLVFRRRRTMTSNIPTGASSRFTEGAAISPSLTRRANHRHNGIITKIEKPALPTVAGLFSFLTARQTQYCEGHQSASFPSLARRICRRDGRSSTGVDYFIPSTHMTERCPFPRLNSTPSIDRLLIGARSTLRFVAAIRYLMARSGHAVVSFF